LIVPYSVGYAALCGFQAGAVLAPRPERFARIAALRSVWWAAAPALSIVVVIFAIRADTHTASWLAYLALVATPVLALVALLCLWPRWPLAGALVAGGLFALAWGSRGSLAGDLSAAALTVLGCATLGALLAQVAPLRWLKWGIVLMACVDTTLVVAQLLQAPNTVLSTARPAAGLPQLQRVVVGGAQMGYGDVFVAAVLGGVVARECRSRPLAAAIVLVLALAFGLLFWWVNELPATVPVAGALGLMELLERRRQVAGALTEAT
jgi:hypothetical protein